MTFFLFVKSSMRSDGYDGMVVSGAGSSREMTKRQHFVMVNSGVFRGFSILKANLNIFKIVWRGFAKMRTLVVVLGFLFVSSCPSIFGLRSQTSSLPCPLVRIEKPSKANLCPSLLASFKIVHDNNFAMASNMNKLVAAILIQPDLCNRRDDGTLPSLPRAGLCNDREGTWRVVESSQCRYFRCRFVYW